MLGSYFWQALFTVQKQINKGNNFQNILSLTLRGVVNNNLDNPEGLVPKDYGTYQIFEKGDLVFKLIDLENFRTSRVGLVHERGAMSPAYIRLCVDSRFDEKYIFTITTTYTLMRFSTSLVQVLDLRWGLLICLICQF